MPIDATAVRVGLTGVIAVAPIGTALPTTAAAALDAAFVDLGYLTDAGLRENASNSVNDLIAWQNAALIRRVQTSDILEFSFDLFQTDDGTLDFYYGDYTEIAGPPATGAVEYTGAQRVAESFSFTVVDGAKTTRIVLPNAQLTAKGEVSYQTGSGIIYPATISAYPDASQVKMYRYYDPAV